LPGTLEERRDRERQEAVAAAIARKESWLRDNDGEAARALAAIAEEEARVEADLGEASEASGPKWGYRSIFDANEKPTLYSLPPAAFARWGRPLVAHGTLSAEDGAFRFHLVCTPMRNPPTVRAEKSFHIQVAGKPVSCDKGRRPVTSSEPPSFSLDEIQAARQGLGDMVAQTPVRRWTGLSLDGRIDHGTEVWLKQELFQVTGSFKVRGVLLVMRALPAEALARGVTTMSAGNHAIAVAYAARFLGTTAKVVMPKTASPARIRLAREQGAEVELVEHVHAAAARVKEIEAQEGRVFVHPFEGPGMALGAATVGFELAEQVPDLDAVVVPIGGGGLCAGVSLAIKRAQPRCQVFGVEPEGADTMHRSFAAGSPQAIDAVRTIADSLGAPFAAPFSFALCRANVDALVKVSDDQLRDAMRLLFSSAKLAVEPAAAASTAALLGPLRERLGGKRVALVVSGTNLDPESYARHLTGPGG
jgi:threonine dehydratase